MPAREPWLSIPSLPPGASYGQMLEFFGIPPHDAGQLESNIKAKRRDWHAKSNGGNPVGRAKAKEVGALIQRLSQALLLGMADGDGGGGASPEILDLAYKAAEELWRIVSEFIFTDDYDQALRMAREALREWANADAASILAWVIATGFSNGALVHPGLLTEGQDASEIAIRDQPEVPRNWESAVTLQLASARAQDALATLDRAERAVGNQATPLMYLLRARASITLDRVEDAMVAAVRAVHVAASDPAGAAAIRSGATDLLVTRAARLLPISSPAELNRYVEMVNVAAWCSYGVPEAEDQIREYRMWAANAGKRVFTGSDRMRSFLAVCTGFISLPIHNYFRSAPAWKVWAEGLGHPEEPTYAFALVGSPGYVQHIHNVKLDVSVQLA